MSSIFSSDDTSLIEKFVQGSNQLLCNDKVRMETTGNTSQIVTRAGMVVAVMHFQNQPRTALVKINSSYTDILEEHLQGQNFVLMGQSKRAGYLEYCQYVVPAGYQTFYTEPALLWKKWWPTERFKNKQRFNMNILVRMKDNWYPVQNIVVDAGTFTIKTLAGQIDVGGSGQVLWLSQIKQEEESLAAPAKSDVWDHSSDLVEPNNSPAAVPASEPEQLKQPVAPPAPPAFQKKINDLEMKLYKQQQSTIAAEQRAILAEKRAAVAEEQLARLQSSANKPEMEINWIH